MSTQGERIQRIVEVCGAWPEGRVGVLELVRLLGGVYVCMYVYIYIFVYIYTYICR